MNRDWFAKTQPETKGKIAMVAQYPPVLVESFCSLFLIFILVHRRFV